MADHTKPIFPEIRWAQRSSAEEPEKNKLWITVAVPQLKTFDVQATSTTFKFTGEDATRKYALELELYDEIDTEFTRQAATQQHVLVELRKKNPQQEYWPRLTKDKTRRPYVRTDFDKWVDEDEQEEVPAEDPMAGMGGMGGGPPMGDGNMDLSSMLGGMGGAGGAGGDGNFDLNSMLGNMGGDGPGGFDMSKLDALKAAAGNAGDAGAEAEDEDENDETTSQLGKAAE